MPFGFTSVSISATVTLKTFCLVLSTAASLPLYRQETILRTIGGKLVSRQTLLHNRVAGTVGTMKLKSVFGNISANHTDSSVDLPFKVEVLQCYKASVRISSALAARVGMVHYISPPRTYKLRVNLKRALRPSLARVNQPAPVHRSSVIVRPHQTRYENKPLAPNSLSSHPRAG